MKKNINLYLEDILKTINKIDKYLNSIPYKTFLKEDLRQDAVLRQMEIIGEVSSRLPESFKTKYPQFPISKAVSMRNILIHGYDDVDLKIVWNTIKQDLPVFKKQIEKILKSGSK